ncbi:hypothetical protein LBMAG27_05250 [Bacteroidota bacterium]|nr:hypothetical protein LBMAG27_05250 [Bacteroidota bacterium]
MEYSQSSSTNPGQLRISVETPNIGHGPLHTLTTNTYVCPDSTYYGSAPTTCNDGSAPKTLVNQEIFHKNGSTMTSWQHTAGSMTYHPTHGHMHYDDWGIYTLRLQIPGVTDPLLWPIVGTGAKLGFCLLDYGDCDTYGDCRNGSGPIIHNADFENFGLGGGGYNCTPNQQGISVGWADVYYQYLDGMYITIPPGTCNGNYYIVIQVDPKNYFLEEDETNNVLAMPWTLNQQDAPGNPVCTIIKTSNTNSTTYCSGDTVTLTAEQAAFSYSWSNGATTRNIKVTQTGSYTCTINYPCGIVTSNPVSISFTNPSTPVVTNSSLCGPGNAMLSATGNGNISWFNASSGGSAIASGNNLNLNNVQTTATYYAQNDITTAGASSFDQPFTNAIGAGANQTDSTRYEIFTVYSSCILKTVKVYATGAGNRKIVLRDQNGTPLQSVTANIPNGESTVTLNFNLSPGNYRLGCGNTIPNLYRNNAGVAYPYSLSGLLSITGSSAGAAYYYYYYNWEVQTLPTICSSNRIAATITVNSVPTPSVSGIAAICNTTPANLSASAGFNSYLWSNGASTQNISTTVAGNYSVTVVDANSCSGSSSTFNLTNSTYPVATVTPNGSTTNCKGVVLTLTANSGTGYSYQWKKNGLTISGATNISYNPIITGGYRTQVTNAAGCSKFSANTIVTFYNLPTATITPLGSTNICLSGSVVLQANTGTGYLYQWRKNGLNIPGATIQSYNATLIGGYRVLITDVHGCQKLSTSTSVTSCRMEDVSISEGPIIFSIHPNPNNGNFNIDLSSDELFGENIEIEIFNSIGQKIYSDNLEITEVVNSINVQLKKYLSSGMYLVKLSSVNQSFSRSFIIE